MLSCAVLTALALWLPAAAPPAPRAQPAAVKPGSAEDPRVRKKVQAYLDLAGDLFRSGDFEGALAELRRAEALTDLAVVRYNIARCSEELGREVDAVGAFDKYLALTDTTAGAADRQKRARETVARLAPKLFGGLEVTCPVEGSSVFVMELMQAPATCPWKAEKVPAGTYEVQTFSPGFAPFVTKVTVPPGKSVLVAAQAVPVPPSPPAAAADKDKADPAASSDQPASAREPEQPAKAKPISENGYNVSVF
ncbi:MAG TPA: PEGA domain-containing protein [Myxococcales bacterium]